MSVGVFLLHLSSLLTSPSRNAACLFAVAVASVVVVKSNVRNKKEARYSPPAVANSAANGREYYDNIAQVRPGFPLPQHQKQEQHERKSVYEGTGMSRESRKKGDKLGFFDRWWN